jgi:hypothetical protein
MNLKTYFCVKTAENMSLYSIRTKPAKKSNVDVEKRKSNGHSSKNERRKIMKIAVLGWGSLIWKQDDLCIEGDWHTDGPTLAVEFARISSKDDSDNTRLTLVLYPDSDKVKVLWAMSGYENLDDAIENLRLREGMPSSRNIGYLDLVNNQKNGRFPKIIEDVENWAKSKNLDAIIWTDLPSNFKDVTGLNLEPSNVIEFLESLTPQGKAKSEEYVKKTPLQVRTKMRKVMEKELGWKKSIIEIIRELFIQKRFKLFNHPYHSLRVQ